METHVCYLAGQVSSLYAILFHSNAGGRHEQAFSRTWKENQGTEQEKLREEVRGY